MMARNKIDPAVSRAAYAEATKALKAKHSAEFADLLDAAYAALDTESPRKRSLRLANEAQAKKDAAAAKRAEREQAKIAEAKALLAAAGYSIPNPEDTLLEIVGEGAA